MTQKKSLLTLIIAPILLLAMGFISYISLFHNDAISNIQFLNTTFGPQSIWILNTALLLIIVPVSLNLMEIITGEFGLERFKRIAAVSIGMTTLGFAALQFIGAIATSSAEGATVVVEIVQQIAHFSGHGFF